MSPGKRFSLIFPGWSIGISLGSTNAVSALLCSKPAIVTRSIIQKAVGTCFKWVIAGPDTCASKRNELPSTFSPTKNPITASIDTRLLLLLLCIVTKWHHWLSQRIQVGQKNLLEEEHLVSQYSTS